MVTKVPKNPPFIRERMRGDGAGSVTKEEIHRLADKAKMQWDNNPSFMSWSKNITGKRHLDDMSQAQLRKMKKAILEKTAVIHEQNGKYVLKSKDGKKTLGTHETKEKALAQERAIQASKHGRKKTSRVSAYAFERASQLEALGAVTRVKEGSVLQAARALRASDEIEDAAEELAKRVESTPDHPTKRLLERTNLDPKALENLRSLIKSKDLSMLTDVGHVNLGEQGYAVLKRVKGAKKPIVATFLSKDMSPPGSLLNEQLGGDVAALLQAKKTKTPTSEF